MMLSVIVPVYNEELYLMEVLERINNVPIDKEIIIINDGSTDGTAQLLNELNLPNCKIIHHTVNSGKGASIRTGLKYVRGDVVVIQDADLELNPNEYLNLIKPIEEGKTKVVFGSRYLGRGKVGDIYCYIANRILTFLINVLYRTNLTDINTCYKMFSASLIKELDLKSNGFDIEPELVAKLLKRGGKIIEVPISYNPRTSKQGKKIKAKDFFKDVMAIFKYRKDWHK